jgi:hypothetical protein
LVEHILDDITLPNAPCVPNVVGTKKLFIKEFDIFECKYYIPNNDINKI